MIILISLSAGVIYANAHKEKGPLPSPVLSPVCADKSCTAITINGNRNLDAVVFNHDEHAEMYVDGESCNECHHLSLPEDETSACFPCHKDMGRKTPIFGHDTHTAQLGDKWSCRECHESGRAKNLESSKKCHECHGEDMGMKATERGRFDFLARSYKEAMHGLCVECHKEMDEEMAECRYCHTTRKSKNP